MKAVPSLPRFMSININLDIWVPLHHYPTNFQILSGQWCQIADISLISGVHSGSVRKGVPKSHEHPPQGGEALGPIKAMGCWPWSHKFPLSAVAEPGGCS